MLEMRLKAILPAWLTLCNRLAINWTAHCPD